jgi:hypothetical protein
MTRRKFTEPAKDVDSQSKDLSGPDGFSDRSSTLPSYEDAVGGTAASTTDYLKVESGDDKNVSGYTKSVSSGVEQHFLLLAVRRYDLIFPFRR